MKWFTRTAALLIALLILVTTLPATAFAADNDDLAQVKQLIIDNCTLENEMAGNDAHITEDSLYHHGQRVDISQYAITKEQLAQIYEEVRYEGKLPWYMAPNISYSMNQETGLVTGFYPLYALPARFDRAAYEIKVAEILAEIIHPDMSDWQMALAIHDYLVTHCAYDESLVLNTGYDLIVNGSTVCIGYAQAYQDLLRRVGIPCVIVSSDTMGDTGHAWNLVQLYGNWYHVDATWDDPVSDVYGRVQHTYFLVTDEQLGSEEGGHYGWVTDIPCTDTSFQDAFWEDVDSAIYYPSADVSYFRQYNLDTWQKRVISRDSASGEHTTLKTDDQQAYDLGTGRYLWYYHNSLSYWNGRIYANTENSVYSMNPDGSDVRTEFSYDVSGNGKFIRGCFVENGVMYLSLFDAQHNVSSLEVSLDPNGYAPYHIHSYEHVITEPGCTQYGYTTHTCQCGLSLATDAIPPIGHTYGEGSVTREPTNTQPGIMEYRCLYCEEYYEEEIPVIEEETQDYIPADIVEEDSSSGSWKRIGIIVCAIVILGLLRVGKKKK